jgi:hypothetical protein
MILPYLPRLVCLALASFFAVFLVTAAVVRTGAPFAIRRARRLIPRVAARLLLTLRILPAALGAVAALVFCVPSFLWFEPEPFEEPVGLVCLCMAAFTLLLCGHAAVRAFRASIRSILLTRRCVRSGRRMSLGDRLPALVVEGCAPFLALTGIVRPRVVISRGLVEALPEEELAVVLRHESAHRASRDNLKRLCMLLSPLGCRELERAWKALAEYAADDAAASGDAARSLALASALVRVARFGGARSVTSLATPFLGDAADLSSRVDRLLNAPPCLESPRRAGWFGAVSILLVACCVAPVMFQAATFQFVQSVLERLVR